MIEEGVIRSLRTLNPSVSFELSKDFRLRLDRY
jgi:hypothetical protein